MNEVTPEKYVVFSDLHARPNLLSAVVETYQQQNPTFVSAGDLITGKNTKETIERFMSLGAGAIGLMGNHEESLRAAIIVEDEEVKRDLAVRLHGRYLSRIYESYGIKNVPINPGNQRAFGALQRLTERIEIAGHMDYFKYLRPYLETDTFLAVHAGLLPNQLWDSRDHQMSQKTKLDKYTTGSFDDDYEEPIQIFDDKFYSLSTNPTTPYYLGKVLITGHAHIDKDEAERVTSHGRRVRLATTGTEKGPLYVWESWTGSVKAVYSNG